MLALQCSIAGLKANVSILGSSVALIKISSISMSLENGKQERVRLKGNETFYRIISLIMLKSKSTSEFEASSTIASTKLSRASAFAMTGVKMESRLL